MRLLGFAFLSAVLGCHSSDPPKKDPAPLPKKHAVFHGKWLCIGMEVEGETYAQAAFDGTTLTTDGEDWVLTSLGVASKIKVSLNEAKDPKEVDLYYERFGADAPPFLGIYKFDGDQLTICRATGAGARPVEFRTSKAGGAIMVFRRDLE